AGAGPGRQEQQTEPLPAFLRPGGGMAPVAFLTGCRAAKIAPGSSKKCKSMTLLLGYTGKNVIELVEPGVAGKVLWRSRKSLVKIAKQSIGSRISSWFRGKKPSEGGSAPPQAIAGLYLRETHSDHLALMMMNKDSGGDSAAVPTEGDEGRADENGVDGGDGGNNVGSGGVGGGRGARSAAARGQGRSDSEERYAAMLIPGGRLCVFGTRGGARCMSHGVHRWVTHA
ncbi:unnamed protein product, partial [Hapterophycus canaliculatus]